MPAASKQYYSAAFAQSTWGRHAAALNSLKQYETSSNTSNTWPLSIETLECYVTWAFSQRGLKASTVNSYLNSLKTIHSLRKLPSDNFDSYCIQTLIKGGENLELYNTEIKATRKVMSLPLLKIIGHEISLTDWSCNSKQIFWTACTVGFFGSFRMGEILPRKQCDNCLEDTLLWKDVKIYSNDHVLIHVKTPKSACVSGEFVDIFSFNGHGVCPVKAIIKLRNSHKCIDVNTPVFTFESGKCLTQKIFNDTVRSLLVPRIGTSSAEISGHSFRAGIPAVLAKFPNIANSDEIMGWGRWKSGAFKVYTRLLPDQRRDVFHKITNLLNITSP